MENSTTIEDVPTLQTFRERIPEARTLTKDISTARSSTDDLSTARTLTEETQEPQALAEDIIIKCNLEEMTKSFFQDYVIVWHDPNITSQENHQYFAQLKKFCDVFTFSEWQKATDFIQTNPAAFHVVTSGKNGELLVKEISSNPNVVNIYIFCENKEYHSNWAKVYGKKVSCVETEIESLLSQIQHNLLEWYRQASSLKLNLPAFAPIFNDTDKSQMNNLHRFLKVIPDFQNRLQAKKDFLRVSKAIYSDQHNTQTIADFEKNYHNYNKEKTLRWYTQDSFLYKVTNNCLRIATSDSVQYCRLLLQDIQRAIKEQYQTKSKNFNGLLYRGAYLSQEEWSSLKAHINREIEMYGFLSVSKLKKIGLNFMKADPSKKVFITIIVPKGPNEEEQGFAEVEEFSQFPAEKEILFNVRSRFTILETEDDGPYRHLILLYGAQGFRKFLAEKTPILEASIKEKTPCYHCKVTSSQMFFLSIISPQKQIYFCNKCIDHNFAPFLCIPVAKKTKRNIRGCILTYSDGTDIPFYGYKCTKCEAKKQERYFLCTECSEKFCKSCFEKAYDCMYAHNVILETHPFSFWIQKMSENELNLLEFQSDSVFSNNGLFQQAEMFSESLLFDKEIEYYSAYIQQNEAKGNDSNLALCYFNLGKAFQTQGEDKKALEYYFKALDTQKSVSGEYHPTVASSYSVIGLVYVSQREYEKALEFSLKALDIGKLILEDDDPEFANYYETIGVVYDSRREYKKALEYYLKCLDIRKYTSGENHPAVALCYHNIGVIYNYQGEYQKALEYLFKSLDICKAVYGDNYPDIALTYHNIGLVFNNQGEYNKALEYYFKSIEISKFIYGENHPTVVTSYNNIASVYINQREYEKALESSLKALDIGKSICGENHPDIAHSYNTIGIVFHHQGEHNKAFEYYLKSLEIEKSAYGENHPAVALSYNALGLFYRDQGKPKEALEYYFKSLEINKSVYGNNHPEIANTCVSIGRVFQDQGEDMKAFEYYSRSRNIFKSVYGENHFKTIAIQKRIFEVQSLD